MNTFTAVKDKKKIKYNAWNDHLINTRERTNYSIRRMDLLIISICGAGIYIIFETLREFKTGDIVLENSNILLFSGISFLISITANFISQRTGYYANAYEEDYILIKLSKIEGDKINKSEQKRFNKKVKFYNKTTNILNHVSIILMFIGLGLLAIFNFFLF